MELQFDNSKLQQVVTKLHVTKENISNHGADASLRYFQLASDMLRFPEITTLKVKSLRSRVEHHLPNNQCTNKFITQVVDPLITDLIVDTEDAMKENSPVLADINLFNPEALDKSKKNPEYLLKTLHDHYVSQLTTLIKVK